MTSALDGKRILIVEDEYWIASDLARAFEQEDAIVLGPVASVDAGLTLIESETIDVAMLDVNLMGTRSFPLADRLRDEAVPHVFVTGYDAWSLPEAYQKTPCVAKPFTAAHIVSLVGQLYQDSLPCN